jgi:hypothetical protein
MFRWVGERKGMERRRGGRTDSFRLLLLGVFLEYRVKKKGFGGVPSSNCATPWGCYCYYYLKYLLYIFWFTW